MKHLHHFIIGVTLLLYSSTPLLLTSCSKTLSSPDGMMTATIKTSPLRYTVSYKGKKVLDTARPTITMENQTWGIDKPLSYDFRSVNDTVYPLYGKQNRLIDHFNELTLTYPNYKVIFRAYNEGIAYRFVGTGCPSDSLVVLSETAPFPFHNDPTVYFGDTITYTSWEIDNKYYEHVSQIPQLRYCQTPTPFVDKKNKLTYVIAESDLFNYPGMFLRKEGNNLTGHWAYSPSKQQLGSWGWVLVATERHPWLTRTTADHAFPWRIFMATDDDRTLLTNELVYLLAEPSRITDTDWIRPGKATWEWWHCHILENAKFDYTHLSTQLYKYYIDFAAENGIEFLLVDAGWSDLFHPDEPRPQTDVKEIIRYGKSKGVDTWLWIGAAAFIWDRVSNQPNHFLDLIASWGAVGVKIDFFDRDDNLMQIEYEALAAECAKRHLMVDFHGCSKPTGLQRTYPNVLNFEAVRGEECCKWDTTSNPRYRSEFIFSRQLAGPMDYTPGSMRNCNRDVFVPRDPGLPSTLGTRSQELALFVILDQPYAMLCDSPDEYRKYPDILHFLSAVPTDWDRTIALEAKVGSKAIMAKQKGNQWFVGGLTAWNELDTAIDFSFLQPDTDYTAILFSDVPECAQNAALYHCDTLTINSQTRLPVHFASGGGCAIMLTPKQ